MIQPTQKTAPPVVPKILINLGDVITMYIENIKKNIVNNLMKGIINARIVLKFIG